MGRVEYKQAYKCGCAQHYSYDEYCAMGPVPGSQEMYWVRCEAHQKEIREVEKVIADLQRQLDLIDERIKRAKSAGDAFI